MYFLNKILFSCYLLNLALLNDRLFISDQTKEIRINLDLNFESYKFSNS